MIDTENIKDSLLDSVLWTEPEMKEFLRPIMLRSTKAVTFDPYDDPSLDARMLRLRAIMSCGGPSQPDVMAIIRQKIEGTRITVSYDNRSNESLMVVLFEAPRFKPIQS